MNDVDVRDGRYGDEPSPAAACTVFVFANDSTTVEVVGYRPRIAIELPPRWVNARRWLDVAERALRAALRLPATGPHVRVAYAEKNQFMGFHKTKKKYLEIDCASMKLRRTIARKWGRGKASRPRKPPPKLHCVFDRRNKRWDRLPGVPRSFVYNACNAACPASVNFLRQVGASMGGWVRAANAQQVNSDRRTWSKHYYRAHVDDLRGMPAQRGIAIPSILCFDLEVISDGPFPEPRRPGDKIIVCGTHFKDSANDVDVCKSFVLKEGEHKHAESEMLLQFGRYVREKDPDGTGVRYGWYGTGARACGVVWVGFVFFPRPS